MVSISQRYLAEGNNRLLTQWTLVITVALSMVAALLPDSKTTTWLQMSTPIGTVSPDKALVLVAVYASILGALIFNLRPHVTRTILFSWGVVILSCLSILVEPFYNRGALQVNQLFFKVLMNLCVFVVSYLWASNTEKFRNQFIGVFTMFGVLNALVGILQWLLHSPLFLEPYLRYEARGFYYLGERINRVWGLQGEPLALGTVCMVTLLFLITDFATKYKRDRRISILRVAAIVIVAVALMLSFSRGSIFSLGIALVYLGYVHRWYSPKRVILAVLLGTLVTLCLSFTSLWDLVSSRLLRVDDLSYTHRLSVVASLGEIYNEFGIRAVLGFSPGGSLMLRDYVGVFDNNYVNILMETGLLGLVSFITFLMYLIRKSRDVPIKACLLGLMANMMTYEMTYYSSVGVLFFTVVGLLTADIVRSREIELKDSALVSV